MISASNSRMNSQESSHRERLYESFVGQNSAYYILKWDSMQDRWRSWNWSAFFFGEGWLLYRKMYGYAVLYSILRLFITPIFNSIILFHEGHLYDLLPLLMPHSIILNILLGIIGNHLYKIQADKKIAAAQASYKPEQVLLGLQNKGGVSIGALLLIPVLSMVEHFILFMFNNHFIVNWTQYYETI